MITAGRTFEFGGQASRRFEGPRDCCRRVPYPGAAWPPPVLPVRDPQETYNAASLMRIFTVAQFLLSAQRDVARVPAAPAFASKANAPRRRPTGAPIPWRSIRRNAKSSRKTFSRQFPAGWPASFSPELSISLATRSKSTGSVTTRDAFEVLGGRAQHRGARRCRCFRSALRESVRLWLRSLQMGTDSPPTRSIDRDGHVSATCFWSSGWARRKKQSTVGLSGAEF